MKTVKDLLTEDNKVRAHNIWESVKAFPAKAANYCVENADSIAKVTAASVGIAGIAKSIARRHERKREQRVNIRLHDCYLYDRKRGHYVEARRRLTSNEWEELDRRYKGGESYAAILKSMKLLK